MPERCIAVIKTAGRGPFKRCPLPTMPGEVNCPLHFVMGGRIIERARKSRKGFQFLR